MSIAQETRVRSLLKLSSTFQEELDTRLATIQNATSATLNIGAGPGGIEVASILSEDPRHLVFVIDEAFGPNGKLPQISLDKGIHKSGIEEALPILTRPNVITYFNIKTSLNPEQQGIPVLNLVDLLKPREVTFATGTVENKTILVDGRDLGDYAGHEYSYDLIGRINEWVANGNNIGEFPLSFDDSGEFVVLNGAGFVSMEDLAKKILAWQIARELLKNGVDIAATPDLQMSQLKFTGSPLSELTTMYKDEGETGKLVRAWLGNDLDLNGKDANQILLNRLYDKGIKRTKILYRREDNQHYRKDGVVEGPTLTQKQLEAFQKSSGLEMIYQREPGYVTVRNGRIHQLGLIQGTYNATKKRISYTYPEEALTPAITISALGGSAPKVYLPDGKYLNSKTPVKVDGTRFWFAGNAINYSGNRGKSKKDTAEMHRRVESELAAQMTTNEQNIKAMMAYLESFKHQPANVVLAVLENTPKLLLQKWGWT